MDFNFKRVTITDWSQYDSNTSSDGGNYSYWTTYAPVGTYYIGNENTMMFTVKHYCSSVFSYNENSGIFGDTEEYPQLITEYDLSAIIKIAENQADMEVRYFNEGGELI